MTYPYSGIGSDDDPGEPPRMVLHVGGGECVYCGEDWGEFEMVRDAEGNWCCIYCREELGL